MKILMMLMCLLAGGVCLGQERNEVIAVFWNLENFFDSMDGGTGDSDREFSSFGSRRWTKTRFQTKCDVVAKSILWMSDRYGRLPDIVGFAEIENRGVLTRMLNSTLLRKCGYGVVHHDSGDRRGIDVALIYRRSVFRVVSESVRIPEYEGKRMETRDILHVRLEKTDEQVHYDVIVNHHPSKFGGAEASEGRRDAAMQALRSMCDSLAALQGNIPVIAMGDFNDTPDAPQFRIVGDILVNKGTSLHEKGEGTIRYEGRWELIDGFLVSRDISERTEMEVCRIPFLMTYDRKHPGEKPLRTYSGPRYIGGASDHCPVVLKIR